MTVALEKRKLFEGINVASPFGMDVFKLQAGDFKTPFSNMKSSFFLSTSDSVYTHELKVTSFDVLCSP